MFLLDQIILVAPLTIEEGSLIGAGSIITNVRKILHYKKYQLKLKIIKESQNNMCGIIGINSNNLYQQL